MTEVLVATVLPVVVSFVVGVLVDRKVISKEVMEGIRDTKRTALKHYVENAEDSEIKGLIELYLERSDTSISKKDVVEEEVKN